MIWLILSHAVCFVGGCIIAFVGSYAQTKSREKTIEEIRAVAKSKGRRVKIDPTASLLQLRDKLTKLKATPKMSPAPNAAPKKGPPALTPVPNTPAAPAGGDPGSGNAD